MSAKPATNATTAPTIVRRLRGMVAPMMRSYTDCMTSSGFRGARDAGRGTRVSGTGECIADSSCKPFLTSVSASIGVSSIATANETIKAMATVNDIARMNSPGAPGR